MGQLNAGLHPEGQNDHAALKLNPGRVFCLALDRRWFQYLQLAEIGVCVCGHRVVESCSF